MIKTAELTGAQLDYWVARAEGIAADELEIRRVPRTDDFILVRLHNAMPRLPKVVPISVNYCENWNACGVLLRKHRIALYPYGVDWVAELPEEEMPRGFGETPQLAICRVIVRSIFDEYMDEVLPC